MPIRWIDVSIPMVNGMTVWPGDTPFAFEPAARIASGDGCNVSSIRMSTHCGTHVDAPWHFEDGGKRLDAVDSAIFFGEALLIESAAAPEIREADLPTARLPERVLFKTRNSERAYDAPFCEDYVALSAEAALRCVKDGVRLVGVDYLSVAPYKQSGQETHHHLLQHDVLIVEGLRLAKIPPGLCQFTVLPLPLAGADGAPCRAFAGVEERHG